MKQTNILNLNESEMLALCKRVLKLEPGTTSAIIERHDGIDIDAWLLMRARVWYAQLLQSGPLDLLLIEDLKDEVDLAASDDGVVTATIPQRMVRPVEWRLKSWVCGVTTFLPPRDPIARLQLNPWTRAGACRPVIVKHPTHLLLYSLSAGTQPQLLTAQCVTLPASGNFIFHTAAIPILKTALLQP